MKTFTMGSPVFFYDSKRGLHLATARNGLYSRNKCQPWSAPCATRPSSTVNAIATAVFAWGRMAYISAWMDCITAQRAGTPAKSALRTLARGRISLHPTRCSPDCWGMLPDYCGMLKVLCLISPITWSLLTAKLITSLSPEGRTLA